MMLTTAPATPVWPTRGWIMPLGVVVVLLLVVVCYVAVDRSAATWAHAMFSTTGPDARLLPVFVGLTHVVDPLVPLAAIGFVAIGIVRILSPAPPAVLRPLFAACAATLIAITVKDQLKYAFGRLWPETWVNNNPSWIVNGAFGFSPFHGGAGWSSFPSGHMTVVSAPMVVLMLAWPRWRWAPIVPILLVAVGLYGADYHFVSDMIAGILVGTICAVIAWRMMGAPPAPGTGQRSRRP